MKECKKLFQRDKRFLLCLSAAIGLILIAGLFQCGRIIREYQEMCQKYLELYGEEFLQRMRMNGTQWIFSLVEESCVSVLKIVFVTVIAALFIKWCVLEGKRGKEFQNLLPVKSASGVTYDYLCGMLFLWVPALLWGIALLILAKGCAAPLSAEESLLLLGRVCMGVIVVSCIYSLMVFAKSVTRQMPGILFLLFICWLMMQVFVAGSSMLWNWEFNNGGAVWGYLALVALVPVFVLLSYLFDRKKDIAGNGMFYFKSVHFVVMAMIFAELFALFTASMIVPFKAAAYAISLVLSGVVAAGVHYLTFGRKAG